MSFWENMKFLFSEEYLESRRFLLEMNRAYTSEELSEILGQLRQIPDICGLLRDIYGLSSKIDTKVDRIMSSGNDRKSNQDMQAASQERIRAQLRDGFRETQATVSEVQDKFGEMQAQISVLQKERDDAARAIWSQILAQNQQMCAKTDQLLGLLQERAGGETSHEAIQELLQRIAELENGIKAKEQQIHALSSENQETRRRSEELAKSYRNLQANYERMKEDNRKLSSELAEAKLEIQKLQKSTSSPEFSRKAPPNPFLLTKNRSVFLYRADDIKAVADKMLSDTRSLDRFFENIEDGNSYKKMFERFKKNLRKEIDKCEEDDELEDVMNSFVSVIDRDFLRKMMVALYRGRKAGNGGFEGKLLETVNSYLEEAGFYCRDGILAGNKVQNEDFEDMEIIKGDIGAERHGEITEIEIYPYYVNYIDEEGTERTVHTQGRMIVAA